jgi:hypothetical protein
MFVHLPAIRQLFHCCFPCAIGNIIIPFFIQEITNANVNGDRLEFLHCIRNNRRSFLLVSKVFLIYIV